MDDILGHHTALTKKKKRSGSAYDQQLIKVSASSGLNVS